MKTLWMSALLVAALTPTAGSASTPDAYPDVPAKIVELLDASVAGAIEENTGEIEAWKEIVVWAVVDALLDQGVPAPTEELKRLTALTETQRTDTQLGAAAGTGGTTSVVDKPTLASLLAVAVEHGGVEETRDETNTTFSTSPYALFSMLPIEEEIREEDYGFLRHFGASITVPTADDGLDLDRFRAYTLSLSVGSRRASTPAFVAMWRDSLMAAAGKVVESMSGIQALVFEDPALLAAYDETDDSLRVRLGAPEGVRADSLIDAALSLLYRRFYLPTLWNEFHFTDEVKTRIAKAAQGMLDSTARLRKVQAAVEEARRQPVFGLRYINNRPVDGDNYSTMELATQILTFHTPRYVDLILNADVSWFHRSIEDRDDVRSASAAAVLEASWDSPFVRDLDDASQLTASASGKFKRHQDLDFDQWILQAKLVIPTGSGFALPVAVTWASRTDERASSDVRLNFGFQLDFDSMRALAGAAKSGRSED
jgi:hypothetical protein